MSGYGSAFIKGVQVNGVPVEGEFPILAMEERSVVVRIAGKSVRVPLAKASFPDADAEMTYEEMVADIRKRFNILERLVEGTALGMVKSVIASGAPGVGKTYTVETRLKRAQQEGEIDSYRHVKGTIGPVNLYKLLYDNRHKGGVILLDDADSVLRDETGANIVKAATDTGEMRTISYYKETHLLNDYPKTFEFEGAVVVATNIDFEREAARGGAQAEHFGAMMNRANYIDLRLRSAKMLMARVEDVIRNTDMLRKAGLTEVQIDEAILWLKDNVENVRSMSLRTALIVAQQMMLDTANWRDTVRILLLRSVGK